MVLGWENLQLTQDQIANLVYTMLSTRIHGPSKEFRRPTTHLLVLLAAQYAKQKQGEAEADDMEKLLKECVKEQKRALELEQRRLELKLRKAALSSFDPLDTLSNDSMDVFGSASDVLIWKLTEQADFEDEKTSAAEESTGQDGEDPVGHEQEEPQPLPISRTEVMEETRRKRIVSWRNAVSRYPSMPAPPSAASASLPVARKRKRSANEAPPQATVRPRTRRRSAIA